MTPEQIDEQITQWAREAGYIIIDTEPQTELKAFATLVSNATLEEVALRIEQVRGVWLSPSQADVTVIEIRSMKS